MVEWTRMLKYFLVFLIAFAGGLLGILTGANFQPILVGGGGTPPNSIQFPENATRAYIKALSGALTLSAGGSNQNINLTPSGSGHVVANNKFGVAIDPSVLFHASTNGLAPSSTLFGAGDAGIFTGSGLILRVIGVPGNPGLVFQSAHGTIAAPTTSVNGDTLGTLFWFGYDGTARQVAAQITSLADAAVSGGIVPGRISFQTANTSGSLVEALKLDSAQLATFAGNVNTAGVYQTGGTPGQSATFTVVKTATGQTTCTMIFTGGIKTGGTC